MSKYQTTLESNPTSSNTLVALTTKIETLVENEPINLAMSALFSAILRLEIVKCDGNQRKAAEGLARTFEQFARSCEN